MTVESNDPARAVPPDAAPIFARAVAAEAWAEARLGTAIDDFFLHEDGRLDDRTRAAMTERVRSVVTSVEREIAAHAGRTLATQGFAGQAASFGDPAASVFARLIDSGLLRDGELMAELLGQVRQELLGDALAANRQPGSAPLLLPRLVDFGDGVIAQAATAYLVADSRRRAVGRRSELPAELHHRVVWWTAAALRERHEGGVAQPAVDRALADAAERSLSAHDEGDRIAGVATRLAAAIDARGEELPDLLIEALEEGRVALFAALIAHAQGIDFAEARDIVLDPAGDRLWLALRTQGLERAIIARIGLALADADPRRDIEAFADELDAIADIPSEAARASLAPLALHRDFRVAVRALARSRR
ncbi:DUF2336 domain-containing protein [Sphingomonas sp. SUN019]|uniref:DUF2336 domain-containing protein n=1 Tax=Sphingomonas sp. SUN019 TaxID=2937788 RepID=UPI002164E969|nr:DUF2336 domain-containing protein [Sphingomonas sp. SUN019]UVO52157.1 DUF2336 domain-containing protein [Sphingomonas sp. SUN019]